MRIGKVEVLGTLYDIEESNRVDDLKLENADGYCDCSIKKIVVDTFVNTVDSQKDLVTYRNEVIRHELVHAFLHESGLGAQSWAENEEIVDWIAKQFPKMNEAFNAIDVL